MEPLYAFIAGRELERTLPDKVAVLKHYEAKAELHYYDEAPTSLRYRWEGTRMLGEIILRESGDCDAETIDLRSGAFSPHRYKRCGSTMEFYAMFADFIATIIQNETEPNQAPLPTPMSVTDRADARSAPATGAAEL
jgi:hypothetical protein